MTKSKLFLTCLAFCSFSLSGIAASSFATIKPSNKPSLLAQTTTSACPLPSEIAITFLKSECQEIQLKEPKTYYRYFSTDSNKFGRYLTTNIYKQNVKAIRELALKQEWGNQATKMLKVTIPAGTTVYEGLVAPQQPSKCYPGGGQQTFIKDSRDPNIQWSEASPMKVRQFKCSE